jgi:4-hydroxythreonine-4-phosphate dehydrogenase
VSATNPLALTAGEPAGIGPELCLQLAREKGIPDFVVIADPAVLHARAGLAGVDVRISEVAPDAPGERPRDTNELLVVPFPCPAPTVCGHPDAANAGTLLDGLRYAVQGAVDGRFSGIVTAPLHKGVINDAGFPFTGHTEFLADACGADMPVMLLAAGDLRIALATTHLPLRDVPAAINGERLTAIIQVMLDDLRKRFGIADPEIAVCGLNPHAGEGGYLGHEDIDVIAPVIADFADRGERVRGPLPADTAFTQASGHKDAVLAMYHDQGLPVLKYAGFGKAVNITLGLPIVRTSVDHGTALDIAGQGTADPGSLIEAVRMAAMMADRQ